MSNEVLEVPIEDELDALFGSYIAAGQAPGLVYGITGPSGLGHNRGFGRRDDSGQAPDADTIFPIASMSKSFCACAALIARDRGQLSLSDPIDRWVPEFQLADSGVIPDGMPTLEMLLSMSGGLTEDNSWIDPFIGMPTSKLLEMVMGGVQLSRLPGTFYEYSNVGFQIACIAVGRAVGKPIMEFIAEEILAPLGMTRTFPDTAMPDDPNTATGYKLDSDGNWIGFAPVTSDAYAGACGINSCVRDLARWITWLGAAFRPSDGDDGLVLSRPSRREMQRLHVAAEPTLVVGGTGALNIDCSGYALGLTVDYDVHRGRFTAHAGGLPGFLLYMRWHPQSGNGVVMLSNSHRGNPISLAAEGLARVLARGEIRADTAKLWPATVELQRKTDALIRDWNDQLAAEIFADNIEFDRPLAERRAAIEELIEQVGPLLPPPARPLIVSVVTPADVTWSIPAERGELLCMIHLTPVLPGQVQEFEVRAAADSDPRAVRPVDISARRRGWGEAYVTAETNLGLR